MAPITRDDLEALEKHLLQAIETSLSGISSRVDRLEIKVELHHEILVTGKGETPSLSEKVRTQGRWIENINKLGWAAVLILLGILLNNIFRP